MAQYTTKPDRYFDAHWKPRIECASVFLNATRSSWLQTDAAFPSESVIAVICQIFAFDFHATEFINYRGTASEELFARSYDDWLAIVRPAVEECALLLPSVTPDDHAFAMRSLAEIIKSAAESWEQNPHSPSHDAVAMECTQFLADHSFVKLWW